MGYFSAGEEGFRELMDTIANPRVLEVCRHVMRDEPLFRCSSLFMNPLKTNLDGYWHRDCQFGHPDIEDEKQVVTQADPGGKGIQIQVALTPSDDVEYVPGSHRRWDTAEEFHIRRADEGRNNRSNDMPGAIRVALQPGDAVVFNPIGLHRGRYHVDKLRRTLMLTYTRISEPHHDYFSHQPWFLEPVYLDNLSQPTQMFFRSFVNAYRDDWLRKTT